MREMMLKTLVLIGGAVFLAGCNTTTYTPAAATGKTVAPGKTAAAGKNLALGATITASTTRSEYEGEGPLTNVVDGKPGTRWASDYKDNQTVTIDLASAKTITGVKLLWETAAAKKYSVSTSVDGKTWTLAKEQVNEAKGPRTDNVSFGPVMARYVRLDLKERATEWGFSLYEVEVSGK